MDAAWYAKVGQMLGGWPRDYVVLDFETNGGSVTTSECLPVQAGWLVVKQGVPICKGEVILDWTRTRTVTPAWLDATMSTTRYFMNQRGSHYPFTVKLMQDEGVLQEDVLLPLYELVRDAVDAGYRVVGHNHRAYDLPLFARCLKEFHKIEFAVPPRLVLDTGLIQKARVLKIPPAAPGPDVLDAWYEKVYRDGRKARWNLSLMAEAHGIAVDPDLAHGAGYDAQLTSRLLESAMTISLKGATHGDDEEGDAGEVQEGKAGVAEVVAGANQGRYG